MVVTVGCVAKMCVSQALVVEVSVTQVNILFYKLDITTQDMQKEGRGKVLLAKDLSRTKAGASAQTSLSNMAIREPRRKWTIGGGICVGGLVGDVKSSDRKPRLTRFQRKTMFTLGWAVGLEWKTVEICVCFRGCRHATAAAMADPLNPFADP